jgi:hypothetical protein
MGPLFDYVADIFYRVGHPMMWQCEQTGKIKPSAWRMTHLRHVEMQFRGSPTQRNKQEGPSKLPSQAEVGPEVQDPHQHCGMWLSRTAQIVQSSEDYPSLDHQLLENLFHSCSLHLL